MTPMEHRILKMVGVRVEIPDDPLTLDVVGSLVAQRLVRVSEAHGLKITKAGAAALAGNEEAGR